jgi:hypothetical protein
MATVALRRIRRRMGLQEACLTGRLARVGTLKSFSAMPYVKV